MTAITNTHTLSLEWKGPLGAEPRYELWAGEDRLATLIQGSPTRTFATVETPEGFWTLEQLGFLRPCIHLREEGSDQDLAVFIPGLLGRGHLLFTNGVSFHWRHEGFGSAAWSFLGEGGEELITLRLSSHRARDREPHGIDAEVEVTPAGYFSPRVSLLAALGLYLILLQHQEWSASGPIGQVF